jgi:hypothetical protein
MSFTTGDYDSVEVRFAWKTTTGEWTFTDWVSQSEDDNYAEVVTGLSSNTDHEFKAQLRYDETTIEGDVLSFTTKRSSSTTIYYSINLQSNYPALLYGSGTYSDGTRLTVSASAKEGYKFEHWKKGDKIVGNNKYYSLIVSDDEVLTAIFSEIVEEEIIEEELEEEELEKEKTRKVFMNTIIQLLNQIIILYTQILQGT